VRVLPLEWIPLVLVRESREDCGETPGNANNGKMGREVIKGDWQETGREMRAGRRELSWEQGQKGNIPQQRSW
jgi:hypothetical protein